MLNGHGDDAYRYTGIRHNFSSNIFSHADLSGLKTFLSSRLGAIGTYPEPEPRALERLIAERSGVGEDCVLVTSGATEAIYMIAESWKLLPYEVSQPTFSEYADACRAADMKQGSNGINWLCNPNNPTGSVVPKSEVLRLAFLSSISPTRTTHSSPCSRQPKLSRRVTSCNSIPSPRPIASRVFVLVMSLERHH